MTKILLAEKSRRRAIKANNSQVEVQKCTNCFRSLGVPARMEIYAYLTKKGESMVSDFVKRSGLTQPTVSYHLNEMKKTGLLKCRKKGKEVYYSINSLCPHQLQVCTVKRKTI